MALIPPHYLGAVASLEDAEEIEGQDRVEFRPVATGTLLGFKTGDVDAEQQALWRIFLVTNKHVVEGDKDLYARLNQGDQSVRFRIPSHNDAGGPTWTMSSDFDIAVAPLNPVVLQEA